MTTAFTCSCGARIRLPEQRGGTALRCPRCRAAIPDMAPPPALDIRVQPAVPNELSAAGVASAPGASTGHVCPVCQSNILESEQWLACPSCQQSHHQECWNEVRGCSTYGCKEAPALEKEAPAAAPLSAWGDTKACPVCAEKIKSIAVKCRYCGFEFSSVDPLTADDVLGQVKKNESKKSLRTSVIALFVVSVLGCLAPLTALIGLFWMLPKRAEISAAGPVYQILAYAALALSMLYSVLMLFMWLGSLSS